MKYVLILLSAFCLVAAAKARPVGDDNPYVKVVGRTVHLTHSWDLQERAMGVEGQYPAGGCGYKIEWGDGTADPKPYFPAPVHCASKLRHTYARPGIYLLRISTYDLNDEGQEINRMAGAIRITVR